MPGVFRRLTKPAFMRRPWRITPCPAVHGGAFLCYMSIILQTLGSFAMRSRKSMCTRRPLRLRPLRCGKMCGVTCAHRWPVLTSYRYLYFLWESEVCGRGGDTQSRECYAARSRYSRNYALQAFYARRNRRNSPSMARFLLVPASMPGHFYVTWA